MRKKEEASKKQVLVESAATLFKKRGFDNVGVREIAAAAGVTTGSFYHHFNNKIDILNEIYNTSDQYFGTILRDLNGKDPDISDLSGFFLAIMVPIVEADGKDFTLHRMFGLKRHSTEEQELYVEMIRLIQVLQKKHLLTDSYTSRDINDHLWLVFRGVMYEWAITEDDTDGTLSSIMEKHMSYAIHSFAK